MAVYAEALGIQVRDALENDNLESLRPILADQYAADIADILERLDDETKLKVFGLLEPEQAAAVLDETGSEATRGLLRQLTTEQVGDLLDQMPMDDVLEILTEDVPERQEELLAAMEPADAAEVRGLLQYPEHSAGRLMTEKFVSVAPHITVAQALAHLRRVDDEVETVNDLYAVDDSGKLVGVVSLREVVTSSPERRIDEIMEADVITAAPELDEELVARMIARYDFLAMPIVAADGQMLGIITVDDAIDVLAEEHTEDMLRFGGIKSGDGINQPYFTTPIRLILGRRLPWLVLLFAAGTLTGSVLQHFEGELEKAVALTFFIPLLIGMGGNTGAQTVSTIIRGIAVHDIRFRDIGRVVLRELFSGVLLGVVLGAIGFAYAYIWTGDQRIALVVGLGFLAVCTWANTIAALIPLVAFRVGVDPALVSAPLISTLVDATGLFIYLAIAGALLGF